MKVPGFLLGRLINRKIQVVMIAAAWIENCFAKRALIVALQIFINCHFIFTLTTKHSPGIKFIRRPHNR